MIIIEPCGGLANRMRVIASGIWLTEKLQTKLCVIWKKNYELNCSYNLLFKETPLLFIQQKDRKYNYIKSSNQPTLTKTIATKISNKLIGIDYCILESDFPNVIWPNRVDIYETVKNHKVTYIQTCQEFGGNLLEYKHFKPILPIITKAEKIISTFTEFTIGVHIRGTDNHQSKKFSPIELFINRMKHELLLKKDTNFFLCTDDLEVEKIFVSTFGDQIITYKKILNRQTVEGMQDALIDMYCLSKTSKILGSYWSSFSDIASRLNNTPMEVVKLTS